METILICICLFQARFSERPVPSKAHHPSDFPGFPERGQAAEFLQTGLNAPQTALEERGHAARDFPGSAVRRFFSAGVAACSTAHMPVETAQ